MRRSVLATVVGSLLVLGGCGQAEVTTDDLESQVSSQLEQKVGQAPASVDCPDPLPAETGESVRCELETEDATRFGLTVETTQVAGDDVRFSIVVDRRPAD